ncbi:hypothetical protein COU17_03005 [Candidatus Kaiserbacteria bacterium CG10_big_fil_rev_8_21_14_0_10_49_17]|uniref:SIMPL domain-containing protein n=1 Tax=Candidatus Kaiserbacteria bacterium CG10_big_fil_rev_8_21_14_0_10_49_17 TaxID=1974609 RepID=A0A2M6WDM5_9BACT|nr:MAG: hypothetical protein COU17_03005 [Candidatus Kaiserbacteria bacterium CG10_big_fil_rev_8_21_14_0_10_49_17]
MDTETSRLMGDRKVRTATLMVLGLLALFLAVQAVAGVIGWRYIGDESPVQNTISLTGSGEVFAVPDIATFSFSVIVEKPTASAAQDEAARLSNAAIEYLKENGVEENDIKTVGYNVYPRYEYPQIQCITYPCPQGERTLAGFEVSQNVQVKVRDTKIAGTLLSGIGEIGVENISGLSFTIDDEETLQAEARAKAIADARAKAKQLSDDLGVRLGRIVSFSENNGYYPRYEAAYDSAVYGMGGADGKVSPNIPTGENRISSEVYITYEIR